MIRTGVNDSGTFRERFEGAIATIWEFCKGLVYIPNVIGRSLAAHAGYIGMRRCIVFAVGQRVSWEGKTDESYEKYTDNMGEGSFKRDVLLLQEASCRRR